MTQQQALQKRALLTEIEPFNEPYESWYVCSVEKENYQDFVDYLNSEGILYELSADRPTRAELLAGMK